MLPPRAFLWLFAMASLGACAPEAGEPVDEDTGSSASRLAARPGDPVARGRLTLIAPQPGQSVFGEAILTSGATDALHLRTDADSAVWDLGDSAKEAPSAAPAGASGAPAPCADGANNPLGYKVGGRLDWWFHAASTPAQSSVDNVEAALTQAARNITQSRNSCGMSDLVGVTQSYRGRTGKPTQIGADASCSGTGDGQNTVGFGDLPDGVLGLACVFYDGDGKVVEADIRLNKVESHWYAVKPSSCSGRYSVEGVATHEFGHVFGLGHVGESGHGNLTMSPQINGPCQSTEASLGRGDVLGLRALY